MKKLYLVRHAKSSWEFPELSDIDRPLIEKGIKRTKRIAKYFNENNVRADLIISSPAVRAMETAKFIANALNYPENNIQVERAIYFGESDSFFDVLYALPEHKNEVMIFGHNPVITQFANYFLSKKLDYLPTSGVVCINFKTEDWISVPKCEWEVEFVIYPKMLKKKK